MRKNKIPLLIILISFAWLTITCGKDDATSEQITEEARITPTSERTLIAKRTETSAPSNETQATETPILETLEQIGTSTATIDLNDHLSQLAKEAIVNVQLRDFAALSEMIHPEYGIRFSPYTYLRDEDILFSVNVFAGIDEDTLVYHWGYYDGSGEPIELTFAEYFDRFVYDADFVNADVIAVNERVGFGNTIINILDTYPEAVFIEFYLEGKDPAFGGMDWRSLRLVFMEEAGYWWLIAIVHDEWTI